MRHILGRQASSWSAAVLLLAGGCAAPCIDDGFVFKQGSDCANSMSATTSAGPGSSQASDPTLATTSASATQGSGSESGASASMSATESATDTGVGPSCSNGVQDGDETDVDCGGACGSTCEVGEGCLAGSDCISQLCEGGACAPDPACSDGVLGGSESDVDCGGSCGPTCEVGELCNDDADCASAFCDEATDTCQIPACDDGVQNGDETDVDCGGSCGPTCENGEDCAVNGDCVDDNCSPLEICAAPECAITMDDNSCQACIKASCCDTVTECLADMKCACWLECIKMNNDFDPCKTQCNINGNPGPVTACANSKCNTPDACAL